MTKVASIVWYNVLPAVYGGQKGIALFNKYLSRRVTLTCICSKNNKPAADPGYTVLPVLPVSKIQFINPFTWIKITRAVKRTEADLIILEHPYHGIAGWLAMKITGAKLVVHAHNIEYARFRQLNKWWWRFLYSFEKWIHRKTMLSLFVTEEDKTLAINQFRLNPGKCFVVPYGIDPEIKIPGKETAAVMIRKRHHLLPDQKILLFAGTLDYLPNAKAVENIYYEIAPQLQALGFNGKILICGRNKLKRFQYLKKINHPMVIDTGETEDIENYFSAADLFINPVISGGGIQTKNIDALSYHLSVVCFDSLFPIKEESLYENKLFRVKSTDWKQFAEIIIHAGNGAFTPTPSSFFDYYNFNEQLMKISGQIRKAQTEII